MPTLSSSGKRPLTSLYPKDGGTTVLRDVRILPQHYTAS